MIGSILTGIGQIGSMIGGAIGSYNNYKLNEKAFDWQQAVDRRNFGTQLEQQSYDRQMQQTMMDREDNAVQRRVADLKASGLSPVLAAGSSAGAGAAYKSEAPQVNSNAGQYLSKQGRAISEGFNSFNAMSSVVDRMLATMQQEENISKTRVEQDLLRANMANINANTLYTNNRLPLPAQELENLIAQHSKLTAEQKQLLVDIASKEHNLNYSKNLNIRTGDTLSPMSFLGSAISSLPGMVNPLLSSGYEIVSKLRNNINSTVDSIKSKPWYERGVDEAKRLITNQLKRY